MNQIEKILSKNDTGETGGHQDGFLIPKRPAAIREFLPPLDASIENPRCPVDAIDDAGEYWSFQYIYTTKNSLVRERGTNPGLPAWRRIFANTC